jgi:hypothetical protein
MVDGMVDSPALARLFVSVCAMPEFLGGCHVTFGEVSRDRANLPFEMTVEQDENENDCDQTPLTGIIRRGASGYTFYCEPADPKTFVLACNSREARFAHAGSLGTCSVGDNAGVNFAREVFAQLEKLRESLPASTLRVTTRGGPPAWLTFRYIVTEGEGWPAPDFDAEPHGL